MGFNLEMEKEKIIKSARLAESFLKGFANSNRLRILCSVMQEKKAVFEIVKETGLSQSAISQHLKKMKAEGFVKFEKQGKMKYYFISDSNTLKMMEFLYNAFCK